MHGQQNINKKSNLFITHTTYAQLTLLRQQSVIFVCVEDLFEPSALNHVIPHLSH